ncbi:trichohyalin-like isoform X2 [Pimephales promelas]|uniref:trichohyalin-like isoform X2 n=1 Tax=Pimephales promelas TaxID=90988 RepID=UPI001955F38D|nr:trichohyalin-like isoform X2 [Pimephales promelas]
MNDRSVKLSVNCIQNSWTLSDDDKLRMAKLVVDNHRLATKLPAITKDLVDNRKHCPQLSVNTQRKKEELNQPIMTQESDHGRGRKMVASSTQRKPSALLPMREWEEQHQRNVHQQKLIKAKAVVDTKGPETLPHIRDNRTKVQLQKEKKMSLENKQNDQRILMLESGFRRDVWEADWEKVQQWRDNCSRFPRGETNKQVASPTQRKPSALLPMREWEEQHQRNMHQQKLIKAKAVVDTKGPETLPHIRDNRTKVQLQKEKKMSLENKQNDQRILMLESGFRRDVWEADWEKVQQWRDNCSRFPRGETNKQVASPTQRKPSALLPMREWEEQHQRHMHQQKLIKAKAVVDTKGPETLPHIRDNRTKVQLQKEKKMSLENKQNDQRILMLESGFRRDVWEADWEKVQQWRDNCSRFPRGETNKQVASPTQRKPSALLPMREWEEQHQRHMHQQKLIKAKAVVDTKGPKTLPPIKDNRMKVQMRSVDAAEGRKVAEWVGGR